MPRSKLGRATRVILPAIIGIAAMQCTNVTPVRDTFPVKADYQTVGPRAWPRQAAGGGLVTVDVTVLPGPMPDLNKAPAVPDTIALLSNRGEGSKREKRYDLKPNDSAIYKLVLANDGSG